MRFRAVAAILLSLSAAAAIGQEQKPDQKPSGPPPPPEVEKLGYFIGPWASAGQMKESPLGAAGATKGRAVCRWMPGRFFVGCMAESRGPMGAIQTETMMGYDAEKKVYSSWTFNSNGTVETATGTLDNGTWTWASETKLGGKKVKSRYVVKDTAPESYSYRWETSPNGKTWTALLEGQATKSASRRDVPRTPGGPPGQPPAESSPPPR
jgi:hypothetical protein